MENIVAIIPAAGSGKRMQQDMNKQFLEIGGMTIIERTLLAFENAVSITSVIVVTKKKEIKLVQDLINQKSIKKVRVVVEGGAERQDSIYNALKMTTNEDRWILVHDGARPFVTSASIELFVEALKKSNALIMAVPTKDTIKRVDSGTVVETLNRSELWNVQTPQGFSRNDIMMAYEKAQKSNFTGTDDASLIEWMGKKVEVHVGSYENIKVTTPDDLYLGEAILRMRGEL